MSETDEDSPITSTASMETDETENGVEMAEAETEAGIQEATSPFQSELEMGLQVLHSQDISKSVVFSPASIVLALSLISDSDNDEKVNQLQMKALLKQKNGNEIEIVNKKITRMENTVQAALEKSAQPNNRFDKKTVVEAVNLKIANESHQKITDAIEPSAIEDNTETLLISACYFKAGCRSRIHITEIFQRRLFYNTLKSKKTMEYLSIYNQARLIQNDDFQVVSSKSILGSNYKFHVFLPRRDFGLKEALENMKMEEFERLLTSGADTYVWMVIPKFKICSRFCLDKELATNSVKHGPVAHCATIELDKWNPAHTKRAYKYEIEDEQAETAFQFIVNHPFLYVVTKNDHIVVMGIYH